MAGVCGQTPRRMAVEIIGPSDKPSDERRQDARSE